MSKPFDSKQSFIGEYNLRYIYLHSYKLKDYIDITNLFSSMEIYESIYNPFLTLKLSLIDSIGLLEMLRISGDEFIEIDIRGPDDSVGLIGQTFYIYKLTDREYVSDRGLVYTLHCISQEGLADLNEKVAKSYKDYPHNIARSIMRNQLMSSKEIYVEETKNKIQYISNYWSPLQNLKYLCDRSVSKKTLSPAFLFYETKKSLMFTSLGNLVSQEATHNFYYAVNMRTEGRENERANIIESMYVDTSFDYINRLKSSGYGNRSLIVNPMDKRYRYNYYDFIQAFEDYPRLNEVPMSTEKVPRDLSSKFQTRIAPSLVYENMPTEKNEDWFRQQNVEHANLAGMTYQVDLPGKFGIYAGNIANMYIYSTPVSTQDTLESKIDKLFSGRHLISSICHYFDMEGHKMSLQVNNDSLIKYTKQLTEPQ